MQQLRRFAAPAAAKMAPLAYCFEEIFMWHEPGNSHSTRKGLQPTSHFESAESKRRMNNLLDVSGTLDRLGRVRARPATLEELTRVHAPTYVEKIAALSRDSSKGCHRAGDAMSFAPGGYEIAALAAGGAIELVDTVLSAASPSAARGTPSKQFYGGATLNGSGSKEVANGEEGPLRGAYGLVRPPGHHAESDAGMGFCIFNNVAVAAAHAMEERGIERIAVVDFDVHHGNGTQQIFYKDPRVLTISIHQDSNYPVGSGPMTDTGAGPGEGFNINVPLPPGSGSGAYRATFDRVVVPALDAFKPQLIFVSAGFDASAMDPLGGMILAARDYRYFGEVLAAAAARHCPGRIVGLHEGGYSEMYVPFCGLNFVEGLAGLNSGTEDPIAGDVHNWGYQSLQPWQDAIVAAAEAGPLAKLRAAVGKGGGAKVEAD